MPHFLTEIKKELDEDDEDNDEDDNYDDVERQR